MNPKLFFLIIFLGCLAFLSAQTVNPLTLCETQCRGPILNCFSSPICKEAFETCYPKCHKFEDKRMKLDFVCFTDCLTPYESQAKEEVLQCADFCNFRDGFKLLL